MIERLKTSSSETTGNSACRERTWKQIFQKFWTIHFSDCFMLCFSKARWYYTSPFVFSRTKSVEIVIQLQQIIEINYWLLRFTVFRDFVIRFWRLYVFIRSYFQIVFTSIFLDFFCFLILSFCKQFSKTESLFSDNVGLPFPVAHIRSYDPCYFSIRSHRFTSNKREI